MMVTGVGDVDTAEEALNQGIYGYVTKPFNPTDLLIRISGALKRREQEIASRTKSEDMKGEISRKTEELVQFSTRLKKAMDGIIHAMALAIESRDPYTAGHQQRVGELATAIAAKMGFENERIEALRMAGIVHDLGKISVPAEILSKPTRLSAPEFELIKTPSETGYNILKEIDFEWPIAEIVYQHHERIDGSGYPRGLKGGDLLLESKIIGVADVVEAMASHRPYRPALGIDLALKEIANKRGNLYATDVVDACLALFEHEEFRFDHD
ncbi:MAG: HD domain-containing protein [Desulfobacterales bacterium]|nr:HD domain-containing protein [Desulfobacterales bacterium]